MKFIDTSDLFLWANKPSSKAELPLLISRLIRATTTHLTTLGIPKGKGTYRGGWDGIVMSPTATEFVPEGLSLWEFGTTKDAVGKANGDFKKRTEDPEGHDISQATYIFITPHVWENADEWVKEKMKEGKWKDIKVYDGNKLVEWFMLAPIQSYWLAKEIGRAPNVGVETIEDYWDAWKTGRGYELVPEVITIGREANSKALQAIFGGQPTLVTIQASSRDEAIAFVAGCIKQFDTELQENIAARSIIVGDDSSFKTLVANYNKLILISKLDESNALNHAVVKGHTVILPLGADDDFKGTNHLKLSRLDRDGFVQALQKSGIPAEKAQELSKESGRNITIFRRIEKFGYKKPAWAETDRAREIIPALLLGKWNESSETDKELLSILADEPYDAYISKLTAWKHTPDAPIYHIGTQWRISSALDVWSQIGKYVTSGDLERYRDALLKALQYEKPMFELEPGQRYMASFYGKQSAYSKLIREGLLQSAILIAVYGDEFNMNIQHGSQTYIDNLIHTILHEADDKLWRSLDDIMPMLAEASPLSFLSGIEHSLKGEKPAISAIFEDAGDPMFSSSYYTGVLWGLENLAWLPEYLTRVTLILSQLNIIKPETKIHNSPINSLSEIYLPWHPQTYATVAQRMEALHTLAKAHPETAWKLCFNILPNMHGISHQSHKCRWRKFGVNEPERATWAEQVQAYSTAVDICLSLVGTDVAKAVALLDKSDSFTIEDKNKVLDYITEYAPQLDDIDHKIYNELRKTLGHHRTHPTARWALPEAALERYVALYELFTPKTVLEAHKWIFQDQWPVFVEGKDEQNIEKRQEELLQKRITTLKMIQEEVGIEGVVNLVPSAIPNIIGNTLGHVIESEDDLHDIFKRLRVDDKAKIEALHAVIYCVYYKHGLQWIENLYKKVNKQYQDKQILADIVIALPQLKDIINYVGTLDDDIQTLYWTQSNSWLHQLDAEYKIIVVQKMLDVKRLGAALHHLGWHFEEIPTELAFTVLESAATIPSVDTERIDTYHIARIFTQLDERGDLDDTRMVRLELLYLSHLTSYGSTRPPKLIHNELATSPQTFVDVLKWIFLAETDEQNEAERAQRSENSRLAEAGYHLLESWQTIPGSDVDGNIDYDYLEKWIAEVRDLAAKAGRLAVADMEIAKILACYPDKGDGNWPSEGICKIIDAINTDSIRNNYNAELYNRQGSYSKGMFDGGTRERGLAEYYNSAAQKHAIKWPVTAGILGSLARGYEAQAKSEDAEASQLDMEY